MSVHAHRPIVMQGRRLRVVVLPQRGGKILSIKDDSEHEILWQDTDRPWRDRRYGESYDRHNASGWDECFPTIAPCPHPSQPWQGADVPDHGELWFLPWEWEWIGEILHMWAYGIRFPYRFDRWLRIGPDNALTADYRVENLAPYRQPVLWSAHLLCACEPDDDVLLPADTAVLVDYSSGNRLPTGLVYAPWPYVTASDGRVVDLSRMPCPDAGVSEKLFTNRLTGGWAALYRPGVGRYVALSWDASDVPYVGVWLNAGGWPATVPAYHIGLEPSTGYPDRLDRAVSEGGCIDLEPREERRWSVTLYTGMAASKDLIPGGG